MQNFNQKRRAAQTKPQKKNLRPAFLSSFILLIIVAAFVLGCSRSQESGIHPGDFAPAFKLLDLDGESWNLSNLRGNFILLNFWASWCGPCIDEMPHFERIYRQYKDKNFKVISIALEDTVENVNRIQKSLALSFPILLDPHAETKRLYRVSGYPETFLINPEGKLEMFMDPLELTPVLRVIGPRSWGDRSFTNQLDIYLRGEN